MYANQYIVAPVGADTIRPKAAVTEHGCAGRYYLPLHLLSYRLTRSEVRANEEWSVSPTVSQRPRGSVAYRGDTLHSTAPRWLVAVTVGMTVHFGAEVQAAGCRPYGKVDAGGQSIFAPIWWAVSWRCALIYLSCRPERNEERMKRRLEEGETPNRKHRFKNARSV